MVRRVKFSKGQQRKFLDLVIEKMSSPSLRRLLQFGLNVSYDSLKSYYVGRRLLPEDLFLALCRLSGLDHKSFDVEFLVENWGRVKGGLNGRNS